MIGRSDLRPHPEPWYSFFWHMDLFSLSLSQFLFLSFHLSFFFQPQGSFLFTLALNYLNTFSVTCWFHRCPNSNYTAATAFLIFHPFLSSLFSSLPINSAVFISHCLRFLLSEPCSFPNSLPLFLLSEWRECIPYAPFVAPCLTIARAQNWLELLAVLEKAGISRRTPRPTWHTVPPFPLTGTPLADTALTESNEAQATSLLCFPLLQSIASSSRP